MNTTQVGVTKLTYTAFFVALTAVLSFITIPLPFSLVPVSGQSLAVMLTGSILPVRQALWTMVIYLLLGSVGIPVFAGFGGGIGVVAGPTGGYLLSYLPAVLVIALLKRKSNKLGIFIMANLVGGIGVVYFVGVLWLSMVTGMSVEKAALAGALPFIPGDMVKVVIASVVGRALHQRMVQ